jgi:hypothetical protein
VAQKKSTSHDLSSEAPYGSAAGSPRCATVVGKHHLPWDLPLARSARAGPIPVALWSSMTVRFATSQPNREMSAHKPGEGVRGRLEVTASAPVVAAQNRAERVTIVRPLIACRSPGGPE